MAGDNKKYSLSAEILMDFSGAAQSAKGFEGDIQVLAEKFNAISDSVKEIADNTERVNLRIGEKIAQAVNDLKGNSTLSINADTIKASIENAIAESLVKSKIDIEGDLSPIKARVTKEQWDLMKEPVKKKIEQVIGSTHINTNVLKPLTLNTSVLLSLQKRFQNTVFDAFENHLKVEWEKVTNAATKEKVELPKVNPPTLTITEDLWNKFAGAIIDKFMKVLESPNIAITGNIDQLKLDFSNLDSLVSRLKSSLGDLDSYLSNFKVVELGDFPKISASVEEFHKKVSYLASQVSVFDDELRNASFDSFGEQLRAAAEKVKTLTETISVEINKSLDSIFKQLSEEPVSTIDFSNLKSKLDSIRSTFKNKVEADLSSLADEVQKQLGAESLVGGLPITNEFITGIKRIQESFVQSVNVAINQLAEVDTTIDVSNVLKMYQDWAKQLKENLEKDAQATIERITAQVISNNKEVLTQLANSVVKTVSFRYENIGDTVIDLPVEDIREKTVNVVREIVKEVVKGFSVVPSSEVESVGNVELPKSVFQSIEKSLKGFVTSYAQELVTKISSYGISDGSNGEIDSTISKEINKLTRTIVAEVKRVLVAISSSVASDEFRSFYEEAQSVVRKEIEKLLKRTVNEFIKVVRQAFSSFVIAESVVEQMKAKLQNELNRTIANANISFNDADEPLRLNGVVTRVQEKLQDTVMQKVNEWHPDLKPFEVDTSIPVSAIGTAINNMIAEVSKQIVRSTGAIVDGVDGVIVNPRALQRNVRRALASAEGFERVSDWERANREGIALEKAIGATMDDGVRRVLNKFYQVIDNNVNKAISTYRQALDMAEIYPDTSAVNNMIRRVQEIIDNIQFRMVETLSNNLENFYQGAIEEIKKTPLIFKGLGLREQVDREVALGTAEIFGSVNRRSAQAHPFDNLALPPAVYSQLVLPEGMDAWDLLTAFQKQARINRLNTRNRFLGSQLSDENKKQLNDFLDNVYIPMVDEAVQKFKMDVESGVSDKEFYALLSKLRDEYRDANLLLRYTIEQYRELAFGNKEENLAKETRDLLNAFQVQKAFGVESIKSRFIDKLNPEQFAELEKYLDEYQEKVNRLAKSDVVNLKDIAKAKKEMSDLSRQLSLVEKGFNVVAKENALAERAEAEVRKIDKLSDKLNRLIVGSLLPVNKIAQLGDLIEESYTNPSRFQDAKELYAELVKENRRLLAEKRREEAKEEQFDRKRSSLEQRLRLWEEAQVNAVLRAQRLYGNRLNKEQMSDTNRSLLEYMDKVRSLRDYPIISVDDINTVLEKMKQLGNEFARMRIEWDKLGDSNKLSREIDKLIYKLEKMRAVARLTPEELNAFESKITSISSNNDLAVAKMELTRLLDKQREIIKKEQEDKSFFAKVQRLEMQRSVGMDTKTVALDKFMSDMLRKLTPEQFSQLEKEVDAFRAKLQNVSSIPLISEESIADAQRWIKELNIELRKLTQKYREMVSDNRFEFELEKLRNDLEYFRTEGILPNEELAEFARRIDEAVTEYDIKRLKEYRAELVALERQLRQTMVRERKRGEKIAQSPLLMGEDRAIFSENLIGVLRTVDALKSYEITQVNVNNATNSWTAKLIDAEGRLRTITGTIDKATGELFKHSEALSLVAKQAKSTAYAVEKAAGSIRSAGSVLDNYFPAFGETITGERAYMNPGGDTRTFMGSVVNTMRYILAGAFVGYPSMLLYNSYESAREFDYQLAKAIQNFEIKYYNPETNQIDLTDLGRMLVDTKYGNSISEAEKEKEVPRATQEVRDFLDRGVVRALQDIALLNGIAQQDVGLAFHIASRRYDNPYEALAFAREVAKVGAIEEVDIEKVATGFEAISSQWGIQGQALQKVANMMIMAANLSQAKIEDLIATQQRAGSMFRQNLPGMTKEEALANSIALSSMFVQATARSGEEGGTFFKAILERPFTREGRDTLRNMAVTRPDLYGQLNPFNPDGSQKNFTDLFADILETSMRMTDESRLEMWKQLFPQWHEGSAAAIASFVEDLQRTMERVMALSNDTSADRNNDGRLSVREAIQAYTKKIQEADEQTSMLVRAGMMDTWQFRQNQLRTSWQISTYEVWENLKGEFSNLATYLSAFLRLIRDNASEVANSIELIAKIVAGLGMKFAWNKLSEQLDEIERNKNKEMLEKMGEVLGEEGRAGNLRRIALMDEYSGYQNLLNTNAVRRQEISEKISSAVQDRESMLLQRQAILEEVANLRVQGYADDNSEIKSRLTKAEELAAGADRRAIEIDRLREELRMLDVQDERTKRSLEALQSEFTANDRAMANLANRARALSIAMEDLGLDSSKLRQTLDVLTRNFHDGYVQASRYEAEIERIGKESGISDDSISKLRQEVDRLNDEFRTGAIDARTYVTRIRELERAHLTGVLGIPGGGVGGSPEAQKGMGLAEAALYGLALSDLVSFGKGRRGIFQRFKDMKETGSWKALFGSEFMRGADGKILRDINDKPIRVKDIEKEMRTVSNATKDAGWMSRVGGAVTGGIGAILGGAGGMLKRVGGAVLRGIPVLGQALLFADAAQALLDPITALGMTETEKKSIRAQNKENLAKDFQDMADSNNWLFKGWAGLNLAWNTFFDGISSLVGGNAPSFLDYLEGWKAVTIENKSGDALREELLKDYQYEKEKVEAQIEAQEELNKKLQELNKFSPLDTNKDSLLDINDAQNQTLTFEDFDRMMKRISDTLSNNMLANQVEYETTRTRLLISGVREDSKQMRDLLNQYLTKNIEFLDKAIKELEESRKLMAPGEQRDQVDAEIAQRKIERAQTELQINTIKNTAIDELKKKMADALDLTEMEYDKRFYSLLARNGGNEESPEAQAIQREKTSAVNEQLAKFKSQFQYLLDYGGFVPGTDAYMEILKSIKNIELQQVKNLVDINKKMGEQMATFNLPSGIKPLDYFDYMTRNATHRSVTLGAGGITVNVQIDNLNGDRRSAEVVAAQIAKQVKDASRNLVVQFANDVKNRMGGQFPSWS